MRTISHRPFYITDHAKRADAKDVVVFYIVDPITDFSCVFLQCYTVGYVIAKSGIISLKLLNVCIFKFHDLKLLKSYRYNYIIVMTMTFCCFK